MKKEMLDKLATIVEYTMKKGNSNQLQLLADFFQRQADSEKGMDALLEKVSLLNRKN